MELAPFWVEIPRRPLIVYRDYLKFILNRNLKKKEIKKERRNMTPPDIFCLFCHEVSWKLVLNNFQSG